MENFSLCNCMTNKMISCSRNSIKMKLNKNKNCFQFKNVLWQKYSYYLYQNNFNCLDEIIIWDNLSFILFWYKGYLSKVNLHKQVDWLLFKYTWNTVQSSKDICTHLKTNCCFIRHILFASFSVNKMYFYLWDW